MDQPRQPPTPMRSNARGRQGVGGHRKLIQASASSRLFFLIHRAAAHSNVSVSGFVRRALAHYVDRIDLPSELEDEIRAEVAGTVTWGHPSPIVVDLSTAGEG